LVISAGNFAYRSPLPALITATDLFVNVATVQHLNTISLVQYCMPPFREGLLDWFQFSLSIGTIGGHFEIKFIWQLGLFICG
jgi:hypothetical protein